MGCAGAALEFTEKHATSLVGSSTGPGWAGVRRNRPFMLYFSRIPRFPDPGVNAVTMNEILIRPRAGGDDEQPGTGGQLDEALAPVESKLKPPPLYRVVLLNDDYTPMEFVVN